ncbi:MAG TPA: hypothetical protein VFT64_02305 [Rickettsiales bacterium]|nr:hypothetical protein [Rickettsiales bacterium]
MTTSTSPTPQKDDAEKNGPSVPANDTNKKQETNNAPANSDKK